MRLSLSTHLFVFNDLSDEIVGLFPKYRFAEAEVWAMPPHFPLDDPEAAGALAERFARHGVRPASVHSPLYPNVASYRKDRWYSFSALEEEHRRASVEAAERAGRWLASRGGGVMVMHTGFPAESWYPHRWAAFLGSLNDLLDRLPGSIRLAVENTPGEASTVDTILDIVHRYPADRVGLCLDLGHANMAGPVPRAIRAAGSRLMHVHASDNRGVKDDHLVPGRGIIPWPDVVGALREVGFDGCFTLELRDYTTGGDAMYRSFDEILAECRRWVDERFGEGA